MNKEIQSKEKLNHITEGQLNKVLRKIITNEKLDKRDASVCFELIFKAGASFPKDKDTILAAIENEFNDVVKMSIKQDAIVEEEFFIKALEMNDISLAEYLLDKANTLSNNWGAGISKAIILNQVELVKKFINLGYDINSNDGFALLTAIRCKCEEIFDLLVEAGADVKINNNTPICVATSEAENINIVKKLIDLGVDVTTQNNSALINCVQNDKYGTHLQILNLLIESGCDVTARNCEAFNYCIRNGNNLFVEILVSTNKISSEVIESSLVYVCKTAFNYDTVKILLNYTKNKYVLETCLKLMKKYKHNVNGKRIYKLLKLAKDIAS